MTGEIANEPVPLPRRIDRRLRLGPFPSARDALKFAGFASVGLLATPVGGPAAIVPFALLGFVVAVYRRDGRPLDERVTGYLGWRWRRRYRLRSGGGVGSSAGPDARTARVGPGRIATVLRTGGVPVAYLPPADARALFESARQWLASLDGPLYVVARSEPIPPGVFRPRSAAAAGSPERVAQDGYRDVVDLLLRRRRSRRVAVVLWEGADPGGAARLDARAASSLAALRSMGIAAERLVGRELRAELDRLALRTGGSG